MTNRSRRVATLASAVALALSVGVGSALSFEPPSGDPAGVFSCDPSTVAGHPGGEALAHAMNVSGNNTAWNATGGGQVTNC